MNSDPNLLQIVFVKGVFSILVVIAAAAAANA